MMMRAGWASALDQNDWPKRTGGKRSALENAMMVDNWLEGKLGAGRI